MQRKLQFTIAVIYVVLSKILTTLKSPVLLCEIILWLWFVLMVVSKLTRREQVVTAYQGFTQRLKHFFSYLGPNYRGPSIWHNNGYVLFKGWTYGHALGHITANAKLQASWADKFIHINDQTKLEALLQSEHTDLGYLIAPEGFRYMQSIELGSALNDSTGDDTESHV
jgi:hypothetical protein